MNRLIGSKRKLSDTAWTAMIVAIVATALLVIPHGIFEGKAYDLDGDRPLWMMLGTWSADARFVCEQLIYVSALIFVGAKFFETRTTFAVTFDRVDAAKISMRGPDEDNIVWIGQRYGTKMEAETVAATLENRLKENAA